jgi:hypothetical protein
MKRGIFIIGTIAVAILAICVLLYRQYERQRQARSEMAEKQSLLNSRLNGVRSAIADLQASVDVGINFTEYREKLQNLSAETMLARQAGIEVKKYDEVLGLYRDALSVWTGKLQCNPQALRAAGIFEICWDTAKNVAALAGLPAPKGRPSIPYDLDPLFDSAIQVYWKKAAAKADEIAK